MNESHWWRIPVIAWAVSVDAPERIFRYDRSGKRTPTSEFHRYAFTEPILADDAPFGMYTGATESNDPPPRVTIIPAAPGTTQVCAYIEGSGNRVLGYEHGTPSPDEHWDAALKREEDEIAAARRAREEAEREKAA